MSFPTQRLRRLRGSSSLRRLIQETRLTPSHLIQPLFVCPGKGIRRPVRSMPGVFQLSLDQLVKEAKQIYKLGIPGVILFGIPAQKDSLGKEAYASDGIIQKAVKSLKNVLPDLLVITDLCFCEYTDHGHCGVVKKDHNKKGKNKFEVDNDATLDLIRQTSVIQAEAGSDLIAPSGMIDGMVKTIRESLDEAGFQNIPIMPYSAKYSSAFYGPFREAAQSSPQFGDRKSYQMDPSNGEEALREVALDLEEGADIIMVKPALAYLDVIRQVKDRFHSPVAAYNVSGEFSLVKAASQRGWVEEKRLVLEILTSIKRAGADIILSYHAKEIAKQL